MVVAGGAGVGVVASAIVRAGGVVPVCVRCVVVVIVAIVVDFVIGALLVLILKLLFLLGYQIVNYVLVALMLWCCFQFRDVRRRNAFHHRGRHRRRRYDRYRRADGPRYRLDDALALKPKPELPQSQSLDNFHLSHRCAWIIVSVWRVVQHASRQRVHIMEQSPNLGRGVVTHACSCLLAVVVLSCRILRLVLHCVAILVARGSRGSLRHSCSLLLHRRCPALGPRSFRNLRR